MPIKATVADFSDFSRDNIVTAANCLQKLPPPIVYVGEVGDMYDLSIIRERSGYMLCFYFGSVGLR